MLYDSRAKILNAWRGERETDTRFETLGEAGHF